MSIGPSVGVHLLVNVYNVPDTVYLEYLVQGRPLLDEIVRRMNLHVMSMFYQKAILRFIHILNIVHATLICFAVIRILIPFMRLIVSHSYFEHRIYNIELLRDKIE
jgi:hypothetical protein